MYMPTYVCVYVCVSLERPVGETPWTQRKTVYVWFMLHSNCRNLWSDSQCLRDDPKGETRKHSHNLKNTDGKHLWFPLPDILITGRKTTESVSQKKTILLSYRGPASASASAMLCSAAQTLIGQGGSSPGCCRVHRELRTDSVSQTHAHLVQLTAHPSLAFMR